MTPAKTGTKLYEKDILALQEYKDIIDPYIDLSLPIKFPLKNNDIVIDCGEDENLKFLEIDRKYGLNSIKTENKNSDPTRIHFVDEITRDKKASSKSEPD